jgi:hypothetical protein
MGKNPLRTIITMKLVSNSCVSHACCGSAVNCSIDTVKEMHKPVEYCALGESMLEQPRWYGGMRTFSHCINLLLHRQAAQSPKAARLIARSARDGLHMKGGLPEVAHRPRRVACGDCVFYVLSF